MIDGREEPSASYKLGNGWVILHWCANLTIILTGFTFIPARINAQPDGQVFIVCAIVQVAVLVVLGIASQITVMRPLSMENWASPLRRSPSPVPPSAAWFPSCGTSRIDVFLPL